MRLNTTVALTFILLSLMFVAGGVSGFLGFDLGREALKGINQLDISPTSQKTNRKQKSSNRVPVTILEEKDILANVKAHMEGRLQERNANKNQNQSQGREKRAAVRYARVATPTRGFPMASRDRGVTLEVLSARRQGRNLRLDVNLRNEGTSAVQFLYSFLGVMDNRGRVLSATANGLPGKLPANRKTFSGTVSVPVTLLNNSENLSLQLTDYPHQKLDLQLSGIPVR